MRRGYRRAPASSTLPLSELQQVIDSNLISCFLTTKHFAPIMIRGGGGRIIYITSMAPGLMDTPGRQSVDKSQLARMAILHPGHQLARPEDVVPFATFLRSDAANLLSGTLLPIRPVQADLVVST